LKLTAEQFQHIVTSSNATLSPVGHEKRREVRLTVRIPATMVVFGGAEHRDPRAVLVVDISVGGAGIASKIPLDPGQRFILRFTPQADQPEASLQCTVAHARREKSGTYRIGAKFERLLSASCSQPEGAPGSIVPQSKTDNVDDAHLKLVEKQLQGTR
jgi:c-di-GMP-binding flagellar brake protein YcgR